MRLQAVPEYGELLTFKDWFEQFESFCEEWGVDLASYAARRSEVPEADLLGASDLVVGEEQQ
jgi:hypothetical protein